MTEQTLTRQQIYSQLIKSPHGNLNDYLSVGLKAAKEDPEFFAHLVAWNSRKGEIRDAKSALALIALANPASPEYVDNAFAVLASLGVRDLKKALRWVAGKPLEISQVSQQGKKKLRKTVLVQSIFPRGMVSQRQIRRFVAQYLSNLEANRAQWDGAALRDKSSLKYLYRKYRVEPSKRANGVLFGPSTKRPDNPSRPSGSVFEKLPLLKNMDPAFVAGALAALKIPFLTARGAVEGKAKDPMVLQALIANMSPAELINSTKMLEAWGMKDSPALKAQYEKGLNKAAESKKPLATLKADKAASVITDEKLKAKLNTVQEAKLDQKQVKGNWLVIGDKSGSMAATIEVARHIASVLARLAEKVTLVFVDYGPTRFEVTGKTLEEIKKMTAGVTAGGGTSLGSGIAYALANNLDIDGIALISDGGENRAPWFYQELPKLNAKLGKDIPVYYYSVRADHRKPARYYGYQLGDSDTFVGYMESAKLDIQKFDIDSNNVDYYSLPNLVASMRVNKYAFTDEIMDTPLMRTEDVFKNIRKQEEQTYAADVSV